MMVGRGIGPATRAPVRLAVSTISVADWSSTLESYAFNRIRIFSFSIFQQGSGPQKMVHGPCSMVHFLYSPSSNNLRYGSSADCTTTFANGESQSFLQCHRRDQFNRQAHVVSRHHHFYAFRQFRRPRHIRCPEIELRPVPFEERRVASAFFLR